MAQFFDKAKTACLKSGQNVSDHFADVSTMVRLGAGSERDIDDIMLTPEEDIKKLKGRVKTDQKKLAAGTRKLSVV